MNQEVTKAPEKDNTQVVIQQAEKQTWWSSLTPEQRKIVTTISIALGISLVAAVTIYFGVKFFRNQVANQEQNQSLGQDKHATWAKQFKNSFDNNGWWGTDEELLRNTLREIPSKEDFRKVQVSYRKLYKGENLIEVMTSELKQTEYNEMLAILNSKPEKAKEAKEGVVIYDPHGWAKRINAAVNYASLGLFWGTDKPAITAVFLELPTQKAYADMANVYEDLYGVTLYSDLAGDLYESEILDYIKMVKKKPKN